MLLAALIPRPATIDTDTFHNMGNDTPSGPSTSTAALKTAWELLQATDPASALGGRISDAPAGTKEHAPSGGKQQLSSWASCSLGVEIFLAAATAAAPLASATPLTQPAIVSPAAAAPPETFVCSIARGALRVPSTTLATQAPSLQLLAEVIERAASSGLSLAGLQTLYLPEVTCHHVAAHSPHRPRPFTAFATLALTGRGGAGGVGVSSGVTTSTASARWAASVGPPDPSVARASQPYSLHALIASPDETSPLPSPSSPHLPGGGGGGGTVLPVFCCSYGARGPESDLSLFFNQPSPPSPALDSKTSPKTAQASTKGASASTTANAPTSAAAAVLQPSGLPIGLRWLTAAPPASSRWIALRAGPTSAALVPSLWALQHLAGCGFIIRSLLRTPLAALEESPAASPSGSASSPRTGGSSASRDTMVLLAELVKEDCGEHLAAALSCLTIPTELVLLEGGSGTGGIGGGGGASALQLIIAGGADAAESAALGAVTAGGALGALPASAAAEQLLISADSLREAAGLPPSDEVAPSSSSSSSSGVGKGRASGGSDGLVCVGIQGKNSQEALLVVLELLRRRRTKRGIAAAGLQSDLSPAVELLGLRLLKHATGDLARSLGAVIAAPHTQPLGGAAGGRQASPHLLLGQPMLLLALRGGQDVCTLLEAALSGLLPSSSPVAGSGVAGKGADAGSGSDSDSDDSVDGDGEPGSKTTLQDLIRRHHLPVGGGAPTIGGPLKPVTPVIIAHTRSTPEARSVLSHFFHPHQVWNHQPFVCTYNRRCWFRVTSPPQLNYTHPPLHTKRLPWILRSTTASPDPCCPHPPPPTLTPPTTSCWGCSPAPGPSALSWWWLWRLEGRGWGRPGVRSCCPGSSRCYTRRYHGGGGSVK